jgi:hypothetical protein
MPGENAKWQTGVLNYTINVQLQAWQTIFYSVTQN